MPACATSNGKSSFSYIFPIGCHGNQSSACTKMTTIVYITFVTILTSVFFLNQVQFCHVFPKAFRFASKTYFQPPCLSYTNSLTIVNIERLLRAYLSILTKFFSANLFYNVVLKTYLTINVNSRMSFYF